MSKPKYTASRAWKALAPLVLALSAAGARAEVTISGAATKHMNCVANVCGPTAINAVLNAGELQAMLASASVTVTSGARAQDIVVSAPLTWTSGVSLTLDAFRSLTVSRPMSVTGTGGLTVLTNDGGTGGVFSVGGKGHVTFASLSSPLTINGQAYTLANSVAMLASNIAANPHGFHALANSYDARHDGTYATSPITTEFFGTFDGLGNTVSNLKIVTEFSVTGFFTQVVSGAVQHLNLSQIDFLAKGKRASEGSVGGLAAETYEATLFEDTVSGAARGGRHNTVGGLVGVATGGTVNNCYAAVSVTGGSGSDVGGLIGANSATVSNSYATGSAIFDTGSSGMGGYGGGLIGANSCGGGACGAVSTSYSTGALDPENGATVGGLLGTDLTTGRIASTYWDTSTSGITNLGQGAGNVPNDPGIAGLTTSQLQAGLPAGFDPAVWGESSSINGGLPYLLANPPQ